jgi:hypothetical protein
MNRVKIALATAATLAIGYAAAFGASGLGPSLAAASKTTFTSGTTCVAGGSHVTKSISTTSSVKAGQGGGSGSTKTTSSSSSAGPGAGGVCK